MKANQSYRYFVPVFLFVLFLLNLLSGVNHATAKESLILTADMVRGSTNPMGPVCVLSSRYKQGEHDLGGGHRIEAFAKEVKIPATELIITPSALPLDVSNGPVGTQLTFQRKGVGWTETANIYHLVYDNAYLGYACGFQ